MADDNDMILVSRKFLEKVSNLNPYGDSGNYAVKNEALGFLQIAPTVDEAAEESEKDLFRSWLVANMPANTIISDPNWWAEYITRSFYAYFSGKDSGWQPSTKAIIAALESPASLDVNFRDLIQGDTMAVGHSKVHVVRKLILAIQEQEKTLCESAEKRD